MNSSQHYRQLALECLRLANDTNASGTRAVLIDMAQAWIRLADRARSNAGVDRIEPVPARRNLSAAS